MMNSFEQICRNAVRCRFYKSGKFSLGQLLDFQKDHMRNWGVPPGKFLRFYVTKLGLNLDETAFANLAWCATEDDQYPSQMLTTCFEKHTGSLFKLLRPHVVLLSGTKVQDFEKTIRDICPEAKLIGLPHYAHRKGKAFEEAGLLSVREEISKMKDERSELR